MRTQRWSAAGAFALTTAACFVDPDYRGTSFRCDVGELCPAGFVCSNGRCVTSAPGFVDSAATGTFELGTFSGTRWADDHVALATGSTQGEFVSRVFDAGSIDASWDRIEFSSAARLESSPTATDRRP